MIFLPQNVCRKIIRLSLLLLLCCPLWLRAQWLSLGDTSGISTGASSYGSLAAATDGGLYVAYHDSTLNKGVVRRYDGATWSYIGDSTGISAGNTMYNSIAVNDSGTVFHAFQDFTQGNKLAIGRYEGATTVVTNSLSAAGAYFSRITCDAEGIPYVTYRDLSLSGCFVTKRLDGASWNTVGAAGFAPLLSYYPSVVTGSNDSVYVSFVTALSALNVVKIHKNAAAGTSWTPVGGSNFSTAGAHSIFKNLSAMCIDAADRLYLAYVSPANQLSVKRYEGGVWSDLGTPNFSAGLVTAVSIAVTPSGTPYVAFGDVTDNNKLVVMSYDGAQWSVTGGNALSLGAVTYTSLSIDTSGRPVVAFGDGGTAGKTRVMRYAQGVDSVAVATLNNVQPQIDTDGGSLQLLATVFPASVSQDVIWSVTSLTGAAQISASGLVTAEENGTVLARATSVADASRYAEMEIGISNQWIPVDSLTVTTQGNIAPEISTAAGTLQLVAQVFPAAASQDVTWSIVPLTGDAVISASGLVTAVNDGQVWAKAVAAAAPAYSDSVLITISHQQTSGIAAQEKQFGFICYPNPVVSILQVQLQEAHPKVILAVADMQGRLIRRHAVVANGLNRPLVLDMEGILPGIYLLLIDGEGLHIHKPFAKD